MFVIQYFSILRSFGFQSEKKETWISQSIYPSEPSGKNPIQYERPCSHSSHCEREESQVKIDGATKTCWQSIK